MNGRAASQLGVGTKLANTAIDRVGPLRQIIDAEILDYAASDLVCYRAAEPQALVLRHSESWDPIVDWARTGPAQAVVRAVDVFEGAGEFDSFEQRETA